VNTEDTMDVVEQQHKGPYLNTAEKFHIYNKKLKGNLVLNDNLCELSSSIFEGCGRCPSHGPPPHTLI
jgi:hypothetical protein